MTGFLDIAAEVRTTIYEYLFVQPKGELLGLSRQPPHDYSKGPPSNWIADSREVGLVYESDNARATPTNASFLRVCRLINHEASPVFYGSNKIILYAEDNNDIFYWLLDIGDMNRGAIRDLEISWAYGVQIESGRGDIHGIVEAITVMGDSEEKEIQRRRNQLIKLVQRLEEKTVRLIIRTLNFLAVYQDLDSLAIYLPGVDGGDIWDLPNHGVYFAEEIFSNSTTRVHACIPEAIRKMLGIKTLTIGYTKDIELAEEIAKDAGAEELVIRVCPEGNTLHLSREERREWINRGWRLGEATAHKTLSSMKKKNPRPGMGSSDDGRLMGSMLYSGKPS
ncbi:MAG: hypothetical protein Q9187_005337 [Circinaria calcarea]